MPRVNIGTSSTAKTPAMKKLEDKIIDRYGMNLNMKSLMEVLSLRDHHQAKLWVENEGIQPTMINGRKRYLAMDVARALENSKFRAS